MTIATMNIEVSTSCSLHCHGCARTIGRAAGEWEDRFMPASLFRSVCPNLPRLERLKLHGIGEPTLNPDYLEIVSIAAASGRFASISCTTHGLSRSPDYYARLVESGMTHISLSVDSLTQEVADRTRTGTNVAKLRRRLETFAALPIPVSITVVASRFNRADLPLTFDALNDVGGFEVNVQPYLDLGRPEGCLSPVELAEVRSLVVSGRWPRLRLRIGAPLSAADSVSVCEAPWLSPAVTVDGYLTPCCTMWDPATLGYLNIAEMTVADALEQPSYRTFIEAYLQRAPGFCAACPHNVRQVNEAFVPLLRHPSERPAGAPLVAV